MRRPDLALGTYHHVILRGARNMDIVKNDSDRRNVLLLLCYLNDSFTNEKWRKEVAQMPLFERPPHWPTVDPLVSIIAFCLHDNHLHLLIKEIKEGGITAFMRRLPNSMTHTYNKKYGGKGSLFQGPYKSRLIESDSDLINVILYIIVKNTFEKFPGGIKTALNTFEKAWKSVSQDPFSSLAEYADKRNYPFLEKEDIFMERFSPEALKKEAKSFLEEKINRQEQNEM